MTTDIVISTPATRVSIFDIDTEKLNRIELLADWYSKSSFVSSKSGAKTKQDFAIIMLKGLEYGFSPMSAVDQIDIIQGKPTLAAKGMLALVKSSGLLESIEINPSASSCTCVMKRKGEPAHTETFSLDDANKMGLTGKDNWRKQPTTMLKWRAITAACRAVFPDVIGGLYTPEELDAENTIVLEDGAMSRLPQQPAQRPQLPAPAPAQQQQPTNWQTPEAIAKIVSWANGKGFGKTESELLALLGTTWEPYSDGRAACIAIEKAFNNLSMQDEVKALDVWDADDTAKLSTMLKDNFNRTLEDAFTLPEENGWNHDLMTFASVGAAWAKLIPAAIAAGWDVVSTSLTYVAGAGEKNQGAYVEFKTAIGGIRIYSREALSKLLGDAYSQKYGIQTLKPGTVEIEPVVIKWQANKSGKAVAAATPLNPVAQLPQEEDTFADIEIPF